MAKEAITQQGTVLSKTISGESVILSIQAGAGSVQTLYLTKAEAKEYELGDAVTLTLAKK